MGEFKKYFVLFLCLVTLAGCAKRSYVKKDKAEEGQKKTAPASSADKLASSPRHSSWEKVPVFETVYFEYNKAEFTQESLNALRRDFDLMQDIPKAKFLVEGHCDESGGTEYNFALGEKRANTVRLYLCKLGVPISNIAVISYGSEKPQVSGSNEEARAKNRRAEIKMRTGE